MKKEEKLTSVNFQNKDYFKGYFYVCPYSVYNCFRDPCPRVGLDHI